MDSLFSFNEKEILAGLGEKNFMLLLRKKFNARIFKSWNRYSTCFSF